MDKLNPKPVYVQPCSSGCCVAACGILGVIAVSNLGRETVTVMPIPKFSGSALGESYTIGKSEATFSVEFKFLEDMGYSGWMAFMGPPTCRRLLVADSGVGAVHIIDVVGRLHAGFVAAPGTLLGCRGVAAWGDLVAVSAWRDFHYSEHLIHVFEGSGTTWFPARRVVSCFGVRNRPTEELWHPRGLRFTADGSKMVIADQSLNCVSTFRVKDGSFEGYATKSVHSPCDVEEWEGGWLVTSQLNSAIYHVVDGEMGNLETTKSKLGRGGNEEGQFRMPSSLAWVPGVGLIVGELGVARLQMFATYDAIAMAGMSANRVGWMVAVARCALARGRVAGGRARKSRKVA